MLLYMLVSLVIFLWEKLACITATLEFQKKNKVYAGMHVSPTYSCVYTYFSFAFFLLRDEVLEARSLQRSRFEMARGKRGRAREACDLLLLSLYCHIPPGRGLEFRTLEVVQEAELPEPFAAVRFRNRNIALLQRDGGLTIHVQKYKTYQSAGKDTIVLEVRWYFPALVIE